MLQPGGRNRGRLSDLYHDKIGKLRRRTDRKKAGIQTSPDSDMQMTDRNVRSNSAPALENGLVNLNTADVAALMTLPGIGESRAKAIISYREQHGAFAKIEDIMKISGIKQAAFSKIKDKITV